MPWNMLVFCCFEIVGEEFPLVFHSFSMACSGISIGSKIQMLSVLHSDGDGSKEFHLDMAPIPRFHDDADSIHINVLIKSGVII